MDVVSTDVIFLRLIAIGQHHCICIFGLTLPNGGYASSLPLLQVQGVQRMDALTFSCGPSVLVIHTFHAEPACRDSYPPPTGSPTWSEKTFLLCPPGHCLLSLLVDGFSRTRSRSLGCRSNFGDYANSSLIIYDSTHHELERSPTHQAAHQ